MLTLETVVLGSLSRDRVAAGFPCLPVYGYLTVVISTK